MKPKPQAHTQAKPLRRLKAENILRDRYFHGLSDQAWRRIRAQPGFPRRFKTGPASNSPALIDEDELAAFQRLFIERSAGLVEAASAAAQGAALRSAAKRKAKRAAEQSGQTEPVAA
jgi:hypothetical protein